MEHLWVIYGLRHKDSRSYGYVGLTSVGASIRFEQHLGYARKGSMLKKYVWMREEGISNIVYDILEYCPIGNDDYLFYAEYYWKTSLDSFGTHNLQNYDDGGRGRRGLRHTDEAKMKISESSLGENNGFHGKNHTEIVRSQLSISSHIRWHVTRNMFVMHCNHCISLVESDPSLSYISSRQQHIEAKKISTNSLTRSRTSAASALSMHFRWHKSRNIFVQECIYCSEIYLYGGCDRFSTQLEISTAKKLWKESKNV